MKAKRTSHASRARSPRVSKYDILAASTSREFTHVHTATIESRQRVLQFEQAEVDDLIVHLTAASMKAKERRAVIAAKLCGLIDAVARRS